MKTVGSVSAVVAAIREEAAVEIERLEREAAAMESTAQQPRAVAPSPDDDPSVVAARWRAHNEASEEEWREKLEDLQDRERWMDAVVAAGRRALTDVRDARAVKDWMRALVVEAASYLPSGACIVVASVAAAGLLDTAWCDETGVDIGRTLSIEAGPLTAGCIVRLTGQPIEYDNSLDARERRVEVEWRAALASVYADAASPAGGDAEMAVAAASASGPPP